MPAADFEHLGITFTTQRERNARAQCPKCAGLHNNRNKTLSADIERGLFQCFRCGWKGRVNGEQIVTDYQPDPTALETRCRKRQYAIDCVLRNSVPIIHKSAQPARIYLSRRMGRVLSKADYPALRFNPVVRYYHDGKLQGFYPALIAEVRDITGRLISLHRTYLTEDGYKAPVDPVRKIMGVPQGSCTGAAIRLSEPSNELVLAEGIESALALSLFIHKPAWACLSAHGLKSIVLPKQVKRVHIGADNDRTGQQAAETLSRRLWKQGYIVTIHTPTKPGADWADIIQGDKPCQMKKIPVGQTGIIQKIKSR